MAIFLSWLFHGPVPACRFSVLSTNLYHAIQTHTNHAMSRDMENSKSACHYSLSSKSNLKENLISKSYDLLKYELRTMTFQKSYLYELHHWAICEVNSDGQVRDSSFWAVLDTHLSNIQSQYFPISVTMHIFWFTDFFNSSHHFHNLLENVVS